MLAAGSRITASEIDHAIVGVRGQIGQATRLARSIMMGADFFDDDVEKAANAASGRPNLGIGANCVIEGAIIDKNARIGDGTVIRHQPGRPDMDTSSYVVRDGIVIVLKNAVIEPGTVI